MIFDDGPPTPRRDKLLLLAWLLLWFGVNGMVWAMDAAAYRGAGADRPPSITVKAPAIDCTALVEAVEAIREDPYDEDIPLDRELQAALREACAASGVPVSLALGVMEVESNFQPEAVSGEGCVGLMQLNPRWFPPDLTPAGNIQAGVAYLGELLERYDGDTAAALVAYNQGIYNGTVTQYAKNVLKASEKWRSRS